MTTRVHLGVAFALLSLSSAHSSRNSETNTPLDPFIRQLNVSSSRSLGTTLNMQLDPSSSTAGGPTVVTGQSAQFAVPSGGYAPLKTFKHDELPKPLQRAQDPHASSTPGYLYGISCSESFLFDYVKKHDIHVKDGILYEIDRVAQAIKETMQEEFKCPFITIYRLEASEPTSPKFGIAAYTNQEMFAPEWLKRIGKTSVEEVISKIQDATGIHDEPMWHPDIGVSPQDVAGF